MTKKKAPAFEKSLGELEQLVQQMDSGELSLEQSLKAFEKGIGLIRQCQSSLQDAENTVQQLINDQGSLEATEFKLSPNE